MKIHQHFIFGYGSLICPNSRKITAPTLTSSPPAHPVIIQHMKRSWTARVKSRELQRMGKWLEGCTAMGVSLEEGETCSGVLIKVNDDELRLFDERERGYYRKEVDLEHVWALGELERSRDEYSGDSDQYSSGIDDNDDHVVLQAARMKRMLGRACSSISSESSEEEMIRDCTNANEEKVGEEEMMRISDTESQIKVWVYIQLNPLPANREYPILQSYVDIIMRGCIGLGEHFCKSFLETTHGWWSSNNDVDVPSVNDGDSSNLSATIRNSESPQHDKSRRVDDDHDDSEDSHYTWIDDRHVPLYVRADPEWSRNMGHEVDNILERHHTHAFQRRRKIKIRSLTPAEKVL